METQYITAEIFSRPGSAWRWRMRDARQHGWELVTLSIVDGFVNATIKRPSSHQR